MIISIFTSGHPFVADLLKDHANTKAGSPQPDREGELICERKTWDKAWEATKKWAQDENSVPVCWLRGPPYSGKTEIASKINECSHLAFSYFFSRKNDRRDMAKFFPTFAYQLISSLPLVVEPMRNVLKGNPSIWSELPETQFKKLIVGPLAFVNESPSPMIIVIDGLDEYDHKQNKISLRSLIRCLVQDLPRPPFRLLFTSRPDSRIEAIFTEITGISPLPITLEDLSHHDVSQYLRAELSRLWWRRRIQQGLPTDEHCRSLAQKSDNIRIYAETLVRFIGDEYDDPLRRLQIALGARSGLNSLCEKILHDAQKYRHFDLVLGAIIFIREPPKICILPPLLGLPSVYDVRLALRGCLSILIVPDDDNDYVRPHHDSLLGLLNAGSSGRDHFIDPVKCNGAIINGCIQLITAGSEGDARALCYACQNWCHHLYKMLSCAKNVDDIEGSLNCRVESFLKNVFQWLKHWMVGCGDSKAVIKVRDDLRSACRKVCQAMLI